MSTLPSYGELMAKVSKLMSEVSTLQRQVQAKKADELVPDFIKMPAPELFTGIDDIEIVRTFLIAYNTYFKLNGISNENTKALFIKNCLSDTTRTQYDSQGYDKTTRTHVTMNSHILDYFIPSDYIKRSIRALVACKNGIKIGHGIYR